jgi:hypothetical protein
MATTHVEMHGEHQRWLSDTAMWRDDLAHWQKEIADALDSLKELEGALRQHSQCLQGHLETLTAEEAETRSHEHALAEYERGGPGDELLAMARPHGEHATKHGQQRQAHERLKRQHHTVMAHWSLLVKALSEKV